VRAVMPDPEATIYFDASAETLAREIAQRLPDGFALASGAAPAGGWCLFVDRNGLTLRDGGNARFRWPDEPAHGRRRASRSALARACAVGPGVRVLDAMAGWGTDGLALARLGCRVRMVEVNPLVFAMLDDRLHRSGVCAETELADARSWMPGPEGKRYDVVYLDPMFPATNKTALPTKPLQVLREIVGEGTPDVSDLLQRARRCALSRVVMKQRAHGPAIGDPDWRIPGRTVRFDVYRPLV